MLGVIPILHTHCVHNDTWCWVWNEQYQKTVSQSSFMKNFYHPWALKRHPNHGTSSGSLYPPMLLKVPFQINLCSNFPNSDCNPRSISGPQHRSKENWHCFKIHLILQLMCFHLTINCTSWTCKVTTRWSGTWREGSNRTWQLSFKQWLWETEVSIWGCLSVWKYFQRWDT